MRDIKFRAYDKENKEMLDVENLYWNEVTGEFLIRTTMYSDYFNTDEMILMQYTGLKDKNGKEIYEGDIIEVVFRGELEKYCVVYDESNTCFRMVAEISSPEDNFLDFAENEIALYEVIGNIYDNPELLEKG